MMAGSRLANFGTIFSRTRGLLETGGIKEKPLWYDVYLKFPPEKEPCSDRPVPPQDPILEIVYEEDFERARDALESKKARKTDKPRKQTAKKSGSCQADSQIC